MTRLHRIDVVLIGLFGVMSGAYKASFGAADLPIFASLGLSPTATAAFGVLQLLAGLACFHERTRHGGALGLIVCNTVATCALFASDLQPFGWVSWVFVVMAVVASFPVVRPDR